MGFQFRGWSDKQWRIMVYILLIIFAFVLTMWMIKPEWKAWTF